MHQVRRMGEQQRDLLRAEHNRQALGRRDPGHAVSEARSAQGGVEEKPERCAGQVRARVARVERGEVKLVAPEILRLGPIGLTAQEDRKLPDRADVVLFVCSPNWRIVMSSIMRRRSGLTASVLIVELLSETGWTP